VVRASGSNELSARAQLELAVSVGEVGEHEKAQPVGSSLVEGLQDPGIVFLATASLKECLAFFATVATEVFVQQIDHGPEVTALFNVDLEEVAQVVLAGRGQTQMALLLDTRGLSIALGHNDAAKVGPVFAGDVLPCLFPEVIAEMDLTVGIARIQEDAPPIVGHFYVAKLGPSRWIHTHGGTQIDVKILATLRSHVIPPGQETGLPVFEGSLQRPILGEVYVVRDLVAVVDGGHVGVPKRVWGIGRNGGVGVRRGSSRRPLSRPCRRS